MKNKSDIFYNRFSFLYPLIDLFLNPQKKTLSKEINSLPLGNLLEIGVGNGSHLHLYKNHKIVGIDTSSKMLSLAKKRNLDQIKLLEMNGENMQFENQTFNYVVLSHLITVVENPDKLLSEIHRVLKPNGKVFVLNHFTPDNNLKYLDKIFGKFSKKFHFKSEFYVHDIHTKGKFNLLKESNLGVFSYFKLLIYEKHEV